ncbi:Coproporphyrinogen III oxidase [Mycena olivaceomarginata]|nr:Coproporphyrinogen III oxidase [Mycena olivaceomarginata]
MVAERKEPPMRQQAEEYILKLQDDIVSAFEALDPNSPPFKRDSWIRPEGGSGQSCVDGGSATSTSILEKAGVNISLIHGKLPPAASSRLRADHSSLPLPEDHPGGLVIHPRNPNAPTVHMNYRYFEITEPASSDSDAATEPKILAWWFGGGSDLTPTYLFEEDAVHFHTVLKTACDAHGTVLFPAYKKWCDDIAASGGIFFDDLNAGKHLRLDDTQTRPRTPAEGFAHMQTLGNAFLPSYLPILSRRHAMPFTPLQRRWQLVRRGRYVEFNLVVDRGTKFGLMTPGARIESILMTLPETVRWEYMTDLGGEGTEEGKLMEVLRKAKEWGSATAVKTAPIRPNIEIWTRMDTPKVT